MSHRFNLRKFDKAIRASGLSQRAISARAGIHYVTTCRFLNGKTCRFGTAAKLARALDRRVEEFEVKS